MSTELRLPVGIGSLLKPHKKWLEQRGLDPDRMERFWGLRGIGVATRFPWSIWVPVYWNGILVTWTTRAVGNNVERRWIHASPNEGTTSIKSLLYGWDYVTSTVIVVEGASDVWRIGPGAVGLFGMVATVSQIRLLSMIPRRAVCFDTEPAAQRAAHRLAEQLSVFPGETYVMELHNSPDPGEASDDEVRELRRVLD